MTSPIDSSGTVDGLGTFANASELAGLIRNDPRTPTCVVRNLYRSTLGHHEGIDQADGITLLMDNNATISVASCTGNPQRARHYLRRFNVLMQRVRHTGARQDRLRAGPAEPGRLPD